MTCGGSLNTIKKILIILLVIFVAIIFFYNKYRKKDLILGINTTFPPFEYIDSEKGNEVLGFDVEIAKRIAKDYGKTLEIKVLGFYEIIPSIQEGKIEMGMSTLSITPERLEVVDFSIPYYETSQAILIRKDDASFDNIKTREELSSDKIFASRAQTTCFELAKEISTEHAPVETKNWEVAIDSLLRKTVDAVVIDRKTAIAFISIYNNLDILDIEFDTEYYGVAVKKGNKKLLDSINRTIIKLKASEEYDRIVKEQIYDYYQEQSNRITK